MTDAVISQPVAADEATLSSQPAQQPKARMRLVLAVLAVVVFVAAVLAVGLHGLIPFGLLLAFSVDYDKEETRRSGAIVKTCGLGVSGGLLVTS
jgi:hypothetical protein